MRSIEALLRIGLGFDPSRTLRTDSSCKEGLSGLDLLCHICRVVDLIGIWFQRLEVFAGFGKWSGLGLHGWCMSGGIHLNANIA